MWHIPARNAWLKNCCLLELIQPLVDSQLGVGYSSSRQAESADSVEKVGLLKTLEYQMGENTSFARRYVKSEP